MTKKLADAPPKDNLGRLLAALDTRADAVAWSVAAVVFVGGVMYSLLLGPELRYYDEKQYLTLAFGLADLGRFTLDGSSPTAFRPPGYPAFLSVGVALGATVQALRIAQFACLALSILLLHRLVGRMRGPLAGVIAALMAATYPIFSYAAGTLYPQTLGSTLFLLALLHMGGANAPPRAARGALTGLVFGVLILCIPTFVFSFAVAGSWLLIAHRRSALPACAAGLTVALLVIGSWQVRNYHAFGEPIFVSSNSGLNLLIGNSENTIADSGVNTDITHYRAAAKGLSEVERDRFFRDSALRWVAENPGSAAELYVSKVLHYFSHRDQLATRSQAGAGRELLMLVSYGPLLLLVLFRMGLWRNFPIRKDEGLLMVLFFSNALFMALFFTRLRFRIPMDFLLIAVAAGFLSILLQRTRARLGESGV